MNTMTRRMTTLSFAVALLIGTSAQSINAANYNETEPSFQRLAKRILIAAGVGAAGAVTLYYTGCLEQTLKMSTAAVGGMSAITAIGLYKGGHLVRTAVDEDRSPDTPTEELGTLVAGFGTFTAIASTLVPALTQSK